MLQATAHNEVEQLVATVLTLLASITWAQVIGTFCGIIATLDPNGVHYRQMMDELNYFARVGCHRLPRMYS